MAKFMLLKKAKKEKAPKESKIKLPKKPALPEIDMQKIMDDFRYLNPNDPGTWGPAPRAVALLLIFAIVIGLAWFFVFDDQNNQLRRAESEEKSLQDQFLEKKRRAVNLDFYRQQREEVDRAFGTLLKQLPGKSEMEALLVEVNQAGLGRGLQFQLFRPNPEQKFEFYAVLPVSVRIIGNYHDLGAFVADIAQLPRVATLNNLAIKPSDGKNVENPTALNFTGTVQTYRYLEESEIAAQAAAQGY